MSQINLQTSKEFLKDLKRFMELKGISTKSEAIRVAVREMVLRLEGQNKKTGLRGWLGMGLKATPRSHRKFPSEDSLWEKD